MRNTLIATAILGGFAVTPAAALPMMHPMGADAGLSRAEPVAQYCNKRGECIRVKKPGFAYRAGPVYRAPVVRGCGPGARWNGYRCVYRGRPGVVLRGPDVKVKIRP